MYPRVVPRQVCSQQETITGVQFHTIDVWQKTSRPRAGMRVQKQKKVANSVGIGPVFLLRADVMLPTGFNIFRVDSSISKSYFFNFGLSG